MKKYFFLFICALCAIGANAISKDSINAVTMASFEQRWLDDEATIYLKNNTTKPIHNVAFTIVYTDMNGNHLDYKDFSRDVEIAPGMTKSLDIPAFNHDRMYHYYMTAEPLNHPTFKVIYELKDYNMTRATINEKYSEDENDSLFFDTSDLKFAVIGIVIGLIVVSICIGLYVLVAVLAKERNRNVALWLLLSFVASPLLIIIILLCIGKDEYSESRKEKY